jgi:hypothetical protein
MGIEAAAGNRRPPATTKTTASTAADERSVQKYLFTIITVTGECAVIERFQCALYSAKIETSDNETTPRELAILA